MTTPSVHDRLIASAITLLRRKGADGFGMAELLAHSGVARRSMYQHFPDGKAQLLAEATTSAGRYATARMLQLQAGRSAVDGFVAVIDSWKTILTDSDYEFGCPLVAAALATAEYPEAAERAAESFTALGGLVAAAFARDGASPDAAQGTGQMLIASLEGAIITSRARRTVEPLDALAGHVRRAF
ncbi:TetR/AcrR family transcriptional regulator [Gordonia phthalatica]|uniref:TetR family transcriptional regulator n=1 Tax=Gordonia phthalatica TaxID=1136941 RepID=A0A0N9N863_9ACTN|nr:TetR/AcrR family transcriptional regulator [Gordonia phthalatica]ALG83293.1 TetR family transcriptional regulator [Gordonia phthalatica]